MARARIGPGPLGSEWPTWRVAMHEALYGRDGFYRRPEGPAGHFRTSAHTSPLFAEAIAALLAQVDEALRRPRSFTFVDLGAGRGELLAQLATRLPERVRLVGVEVVARPPGLPSRVEWQPELPASLHGFLFANEWLDDVPLDVVEVDEAGVARIVHVEPATGVEHLGAPVSGDLAAWLQPWWPLDEAPPGTRAEVGDSRDAAWSDAVARVDAGLALAVDYHHSADRRPAGGTLTGFRAGRAVRPVPDGSCDITAHVALDACAAAVRDAAARGETTTTTTTAGVRTQRDALQALGVRTGRPDHSRASTDPSGYLRELARASEAAALTQPAGLGGFGWLAHARGIALPAAFER